MREGLIWMGHIKLIRLGTPEHSKLVKNSLKFCLYALGKKSEKSKKKQFNIKY